jgi:hypothetical protein
MPHLAGSTALIGRYTARSSKLVKAGSSGPGLPER